MPKSRRQEIREFLVIHFKSESQPQTVENCLNAYIIQRDLGGDYKLKTNEVKTSKPTSKKSRVRLRDQIAQELGVVKQMGLICRLRYGVYVKKYPPSRSP